MIDFRYHLVSIVSIFLALAVGIVLGAGPLQGQIGDTLTSEVTQLRQDKAGLRTEVTTLTQQAASQDKFTEATMARVVSGLASGRGVAIVQLPGATTDAVKQVTDLVAKSGGTLTSSTKVTDAWTATDATTRTARDDLATKLAPTLRLPASTGTTSAPSLADRVLAAAIATTSSAIGSDPSRAALDELSKGGFLEVNGKVTAPAQLVIVIADPLTKGAVKDQQAAAAAYVSLASALDAASSGTVVASFVPAPDPTKGTSVVRAIRKDTAASRAVSTVDDAQVPMGLASVALALAEQQEGKTGHYGTEEGASAPYAPLPTP